jgi:parallel beta-helix repeat protein
VRRAPARLLSLLKQPDSPGRRLWPRDPHKGTQSLVHIRAGIGVSEHAKALVRGNTCYKNRRAGIGIRTGEDTAPIVERNECYENGMAGIDVEEDASPVIRGNRCYRNRLAGIGAREHANPTILENECFEKQAAGIGLSEDVQAIVMKNDCHHNALAGIGFAECKSGKAEVSNNAFWKTRPWPRASMPDGMFNSSRMSFREAAACLRS